MFMCISMYVWRLSWLSVYNLWYWASCILADIKSSKSDFHFSSFYTNPTHWTSSDLSLTCRCQIVRDFIKATVINVTSPRHLHFDSIDLLSDKDSHIDVLGGFCIEIYFFITHFDSMCVPHDCTHNRKLLISENLQTWSCNSLFHWEASLGWCLKEFYICDQKQKMSVSFINGILVSTNISLPGNAL